MWRRSLRWLAVLLAALGALAATGSVWPSPPANGAARRATAVEESTVDSPLAGFPVGWAGDLAASALTAVSQQRQADAEAALTATLRRFSGCSPIRPARCAIRGTCWG